MRTPRRRRTGLLSKVSSPGELHPEALSERCVNLSIHTAPIIQPFYGFVDAISLIPAAQVGELRQLDNAAPLLHSHYKSFHATTDSSALAPVSVFFLRVSAICHFPFHPKQGSHVPYRSLY